MASVVVLWSPGDTQETRSPHLSLFKSNGNIRVQGCSSDDLGLHWTSGRFSDWSKVEFDLSGTDSGMVMLMRFRRWFWACVNSPSVGQIWSTSVKQGRLGQQQKLIAWLGSKCKTRPIGELGSQIGSSVVLTGSRT